MKYVEISAEVMVPGRIRIVVGEPLSEEWKPDEILAQAAREMKSLGGEIDLRGVVHFRADFERAEIGPLSIESLDEARR